MFFIAVVCWKISVLEWLLEIRNSLLHLPPPDLMLLLNFLHLSINQQQDLVRINRERIHSHSFIYSFIYPPSFISKSRSSQVHVNVKFCLLDFVKEKWFWFITFTHGVWKVTWQHQTWLRHIVCSVVAMICRSFVSKACRSFLLCNIYQYSMLVPVHSVVRQHLKHLKQDGATIYAAVRSIWK